jgi:hypothetical protein
VTSPDHPGTTGPAADLRSSLAARAGHLALWAGLYVAAAVVCLGQTAGLPAWDRPPAPHAALLLYAWATAAAVYLLDRVKLLDRWLDPADAAAHPRRYGFLTARTPLIRVLAAALVATAILAGLGAGWIAPAMTALAVAGVVIYAGRPRRHRPRVKDILFLKNGYVAGGITGFALLVALLPQAHSPGAIRAAISGALPAIAPAAALLFLRVVADAALCDLDDESADRAHRTRTLPVWLGRYPAWNAAMALRLVSAAGLLLPFSPARPRLLWAGATVVSSIALRLWRPAKVRDAVDARFALEALLVTTALAALA